MKSLIYISLLIIVLGCNIGTKQTNKTTETDTTVDNSKYYTTEDTIIITTETQDTLEYSKAEFNKIIDTHPELWNNKYVENPDLLYYCKGDRDDFRSEVGQDNYYILYAYFLRKKNGADKYAQQREKLINIYSNINSLFGYFQYGGTYFGHQDSRICGYAEYAIDLYPKNKYEIEKTYDITKQKNIYINSLRQIIEDESSIDYMTLGKKEKEERKKVLNKIVDNIEKLITENFYLKRAQAFQYEYYQSY